MNPKIKHIEFHGGLRSMYSDTSVMGTTIIDCMRQLMKRDPTLVSRIQTMNWAFYPDSLSNPSLQLKDLNEPLHCRKLIIAPTVAGASGFEILAIIIAVIAVGASIYAYSQMPNAPTEVEGAQSYMFNGSKNVVEQGGAVPIICGICRTGTTIISAGTSASMFADPLYHGPRLGGGLGPNTRNRRKEN